MRSTEMAWVIEPHDPLIVRDSRPFDTTPGVRASSQTFPPPSVTAGGIRTRAGDGQPWDPQRVTAVRTITLRGPLLVQLDANGAPQHILVPAPADAVVFQTETPGTGDIQPLTPHDLPAGAQTDLEDLRPVGLLNPDPRKPIGTAPRFWRWEHMLKWLTVRTPWSGVDLSDLGLERIDVDVRTHVAIDPDRQSALDGALFQTRGLSFTALQRSSDQAEATPLAYTQLRHVQRLGLLVAARYPDDPQLNPPSDHIAPLGGERRLMHWRVTDYRLPPCPPELREQIVASGTCRLLLLTPAQFADGFRPADDGWLFGTQQSIRVHLEAIAVPRPQTISGWDLALRAPKRTRRLAPAGTVLFLRLEGSPDAVRRWIDNTWMLCISDGEVERQDGFGLALLGAWTDRVPGIEKEVHHAS